MESVFVRGLLAVPSFPIFRAANLLFHGSILELQGADFY